MMALMIIEKWHGFSGLWFTTPFFVVDVSRSLHIINTFYTVLIIGKRTEVDVCPPLLDLTHFQSAFILAIKHRP